MCVFVLHGLQDGVIHRTLLACRATMRLWWVCCSIGGDLRGDWERDQPSYIHQSHALHRPMPVLHHRCVGAAQSTGGVVVVLIRWRGCWCFEWVWMRVGLMGWLVID